MKKKHIVWFVGNSLILLIGAILSEIYNTNVPIIVAGGIALVSMLVVTRGDVW